MRVAVETEEKLGFREKRAAKFYWTHKMSHVCTDVVQDLKVLCAYVCVLHTCKLKGGASSEIYSLLQLA